jgi:cation:H+ antiporter
MVILVLHFLAGAAGVIIAGIFLTRYAEVIGESTRLGRTLAGALLLAGATSLPELAVDSNLARAGQANLILGDLFGSSLFNLLILATLDLAHRGPTRIIASTAAAHALSAIMSIVLTAICLLFLIAPFKMTFAGIGPGPILVTLVYVLGLRLVYFDQQYAKEKITPGEAAPVDIKRISLSRATVGYAASAFGILLAAPILASAAEGLAVETGLGGTFVGTTLVAFSTSMPEVVTTWFAVRSGAFDLAAGNIFGSNAFNMIILLPADGFFDGSLLAVASSTHQVTGICVILATSVATLGLLYRPERRYWLIEPDAALVILIALSSLGLVYYLR